MSKEMVDFNEIWSEWKKNELLDLIGATIEEIIFDSDKQSPSDLKMSDFVGRKDLLFLIECDTDDSFGGYVHSTINPGFTKDEDAILFSIYSQGRCDIEYYFISKSGEDKAFGLFIDREEHEKFGGFSFGYRDIHVWRCEDELEGLCQSKYFIFPFGNNLAGDPEISYPVDFSVRRLVIIQLHLREPETLYHNRIDEARTVYERFREEVQRRRMGLF